MPVKETVTCYLCGRENPPTEMSPMGSPALGHRVDFATSVAWLCPDTCFDEARRSPLISGRIYRAQAYQRKQNREHLADALKDTAQLATLPDGLRVTEEELDRLKSLPDFHAASLQDDADLEAAFRVLRNHTRHAYYHSADGRAEIWDYAELHERLGNLERGANG
jgi:hypothetical protein